MVLREDSGPAVGAVAVLDHSAATIIPKRDSQAERRAAELAVVNEVIRQINATHDPAAMARAVAEAMHERLGFNRTSIFWIDPSAQEFVLAASLATADAVPPGYRQKITVGIMGRAARTRQTQLVNDTRLDPDYVWSDIPRLSELCVPIQHDGQLMGVINLENNRPDAFDQEDVQLVETIADGLAIALENARLLEREHRARLEAEALRELAEVVNSSLDLPTVLEAIVARATSALGINRCAILLLDEARGALRGAAAVRLPGEEALWSLWEQLEIPAAGQAYIAPLLAGEVVVYSDMAADPQLGPFARMFHIHSVLAAPMINEGRFLGVLAFAQSDGLRQFTDRDVTLARAVAYQAAIAVRSAQLYADAQAKARRMEEVNRLKDQMIQNISHELRLPLTIVTGYVELILDGAMGGISPELHTALKTVSHHTNQILAAVERITTLYGLRNSGLEMQRLSLSNLVRQAAKAYRDAAQQAGLTLTLDLPEEELEVEGSAEQLRQVLNSLLDNAIKFNNPGGRIHLRAGFGDGLATVEVADTGIGIPADKINQVWDSFYQVDGSATRRYGGMGVGLALVKDVIEAHGGAVWVHSQEGQGSAFGFALRRVV